MEGQAQRQDFEIWYEAFGTLRRILTIVLVFPPILGTAILLLVLFGAVTHQVLDSGAATSTALAAGVLLILIPPLIYALSPLDYPNYTTDMKNELKVRPSNPDQTREIAPTANV